MFEYEKTSNKKWRFRVAVSYVTWVPELAGHNFGFPQDNPYFVFWMPTKPGKQRMTIRKGYAWDGCSGPVPTTVRSARASCVHDVLYQSMREGLLGQEYRAVADKIFYRLLLEDRMPKAIAWGYYLAVRWFGGSCAKFKK